MLTWAVIFLIIALIAGIFGFRGVEGLAMQIAKTLFFIFIILFIISLVLGYTWRLRARNNGNDVYIESTR